MYLGIALTAFVFAMLPICLAHPWIGMLMWAWLGYMNPHRLTWHFSYTMPYAIMVAVATLVGLLFTKDRKPMPWVRETYLLSALWLLFTLSTVFALYPGDAWKRWYFVSKILLFTYVPLLLLQDRKRLKWFLLVIALSIGFYGLKGGIWSIGKGGAGTVDDARRYHVQRHERCRARAEHGPADAVLPGSGGGEPGGSGGSSGRRSCSRSWRCCSPTPAGG